jgi:hypothetical protein
MPRFVGQRSNAGASISTLIMLVAIIGVLFEYLGVIDIVPGFGRDGYSLELQGKLTKEQVAEQGN